MIIILVLLLLSTACASSPGQVGRLVPCEEQACLPMILNLGTRSADQVILESTELDDGRTDFLLKVRGRINGEGTTEHKLIFCGYTAGMECSDFGQSNVSVLGFSSEGNPILSTSIGPFEVVDDSLSVGCPYCIRVSTKTQERVFPSPSWDLRLTGHTEDDFFANDRGEVYLRQDARCLQLFSDQEFREAPSDACVPLPEGQGTLLEIEHGACS
jgi:hypothetical protein